MGPGASKSVAARDCGTVIKCHCESDQAIVWQETTDSLLIVAKARKACNAPSIVYGARCIRYCFRLVTESSDLPTRRISLMVALVLLVMVPLWLALFECLFVRDTSLSQRENGH